VSAGAIASTAWRTAKSLLFLVAIPFAAGSFHASEGSGGGNKTAVWIILAVIIAAGIAAALITLVPRDAPPRIRVTGSGVQDRERSHSA
jgi:hypothetical protein